MLLLQWLIKIKDFDFDNILIDEKSYEDILVYNVSYKSLIDSKHLRIRLDKIDVFIRVHNGTRYSILFGSEKYDPIYNRIRYLTGVKSGIKYVISLNCSYNSYDAHDAVDSHDSLPLEKQRLFIML